MSIKADTGPKFSGLIGKERGGQYAAFSDAGFIGVGYHR
ncbi:hypothetical protein SNOG_02968 [Parastagonospora nodorum SN15]|uniref:Uncharacterized protein n=1 Tax=Phaeosphaeria nodorum (strain SN15 / ATCC MYA-4574 / FGSC 10173) TaxID=321614 RepID=Q0UZ46_PHANO|nr:hypothetical protein SNOG_02968 [Parastagonospora nodorum SN15]EAT89699.1 hypothetical protein SNOG_02968 [Parastagonospora nodorum SN15]